jgi:hypothetical protein
VRKNIGGSYRGRAAENQERTENIGTTKRPRKTPALICSELRRSEWRK